jgi:integrase
MHAIGLPATYLWWEVSMQPWLRKQDKYWYVQIDGDKHKLGKDKEAAFDEFHRLMRDRSNGVPLGNHTVREILDDYWTWLQANRAATTCEKRQPILKSFGLSMPATLRVRDLRPYHVQRWLDQKCSKCGPTTRNTRITWIKTVFNWAVKMGYAGMNPIVMMEKPTPLTRQEFVPADQWPKLLEACTDEAFRDFVTIILDSGARPQEMFKFEAKHFDGVSFVLDIEDSKGKKESRVTYLPPVSLEIVRRLAEQFPAGKLFRNRRGQPWLKNSIRCRFRRLKRIMGMPKLCATTLRHSYTYYRASRQDTVTLATLLGHKDTRMISRRYGHVTANRAYLADEASRISFPALPDADLPGNAEGQPA